LIGRSDRSEQEPLDSSETLRYDLALALPRLQSCLQSAQNRRPLKKKRSICPTDSQ
jgi:hypothetical protein